MDLTAEQLDLLFNAWALARENKGMVIADDAYPDAHKLAEAGWLARRFESDGEMSWWWSPQGDAALELGAAINSTKHRVN
jgi:hypothetical protein